MRYLIGENYKSEIKILSGVILLLIGLKVILNYLNII